MSIMLWKRYNKSVAAEEVSVSRSSQTQILYPTPLGSSARLLNGALIPTWFMPTRTRTLRQLRERYEPNDGGSTTMFKCLLEWFRKPNTAERLRRLEARLGKPSDNGNWWYLGGAPSLTAQFETARTENYQTGQRLTKLMKHLGLQFGSNQADKVVKIVRRGRVSGD